MAIFLSGVMITLVSQLQLLKAGNLQSLLRIAGSGLLAVI
jgi:hypothetical protein